MKIMIEKSVYNKFDDIIIAIDGDGSILHVQVSKKDARDNFYFLDSMTIDTVTKQKDYVPLSIAANFFNNGGQ